MAMQSQTTNKPKRTTKKSSTSSIREISESVVANQDFFYYNSDIDLQEAANDLGISFNQKGNKYAKFYE